MPVPMTLPMTIEIEGIRPSERTGNDLAMYDWRHSGHRPESLTKAGKGSRIPETYLESIDIRQVDGGPDVLRRDQQAVPNQPRRYLILGFQPLTMRIGKPAGGIALF